METKPTALIAPHPILEHCVAFLVPPATREPVVGDLFELYQSPSQYVSAALRTVPFVVASQIRRHANIPVLIIQALIISGWLSGFLISLRRHLVVSDIAIITVAIVSVLLLSEAYRSDEPPSDKQATLESIAVSTLVLAYASYVIVIMLHSIQLHSHQLSWSLFSTLIVPFGMPSLCALRAGLVILRERQYRLAAGDMSRDDLANQYRQFEIRARKRNRIEISLLILTGALPAMILWRAGLELGPVGSLVAAMCAVVPVYLLVHGAPVPLRKQADFRSVRDTFQCEMVRQHQLRSFVCWLWPAPPLFLLYAIAFHFAAGPTQQLWLVYATVTTVFGYFLVLAVDRDRGAWFRDIINHLDRLRERRSR